ncbi:protein kinase [Planctomycetota bacterium]
MADGEEKYEAQEGEKKPFFSALSSSYSNPAEKPGSQIGPYKLVRILGEGGYGVVYLAEQQVPVRRHVALKIVKLGMDTNQVIARFEAERQALAMLDHPNIARVYDAGTTETGRPYFVMEFVKGAVITEYCDWQKLSIEARLELFLDVCNAIHYAHQKGIIHRDIKPSNILVSTVGNRAVPKIIDFGVAKALNQPLTERTLYTEQGQFIGTPEYMSPEQADVATNDIDTRSDIYSLGVALYELLTGVLPFDPKRLRGSGVDRLRQIIRDEEPKTPSTRLSDLREAAKQIATNRRTEVGTLAKRLHKELEWIPMMAMRKEQAHRYQAVSELTNDIRNYLDGVPLIAGPESVIYRTKKFVLRRRWPVAAAVAVIMTLIVGIIVSTTLYMQAETARRVAAESAESLYRSNYGNRIALVEAAYRVGHKGRVDQLLALCPEDLRGWEWDWLSYVSDEAEITLVNPPKIVPNNTFSVCMSPDGKRVYASGIGKFIAWDINENTVMRSLYKDWIFSVAIDPEGKRLVTATRGGFIQLWDVMTGEKLIALSEGAGDWPDDHSRSVNSVAFSPDGKHIVSGGNDSNVRIWDVVAGTVVMTLRGHRGPLREVAYSTDGRRILSAGDDTMVKVWDAKTGDELMTLRGHTEGIRSAAFNPDNTRIISGGEDKTIRIWDSITGDILEILQGHAGEVSSVAFSPDGKLIASGSEDRTIKVWDAVRGLEIETLVGHKEQVTSLVFSPDGKRIISGSYDRSLKVWNPSVNREYVILSGHTGEITSVSFSPNGKRLVSGSMDGLIKTWDIASACETMTLYGHENTVNSVSFSPDGTRIISASADNQIKSWDAIDGGEVLMFSGHVGSVRSVAFSPDGKKIVSGSEDKSVRIWDAVTGTLLMNLIGHSDGIYSVAFSPTGDRIVSGGLDGQAKIWDCVSGVELASIHACEAAIWSVVFTPDGQQIVTGEGYHEGKQLRGGNISVWDVSSKKQIVTYQTVLNVRSIVSAPDGKRIIAASSGLTLFDTFSGEEVLVLPSPVGVVQSVAINTQGTTIAVGGWHSRIALLESEAPIGGYEPRIYANSARMLVGRLYKEYGSYKEVLKKLEADTGMIEPIHKFGIQIAKSRLEEDLHKIEM